ncbi:MAG: hypothetical protein LBT04_08695 [Prevotellaceae bacterium]|jgi:hypothetical protein|nr:hypothetical protein [Prevotellaceae bacterium]
MTKFYFNLRNVAMIIACLAVSTMFSGCETEDDPIDDPNNPIVVGELTELTSPITVNTTLKDLGLAIDYVYKGSSLLQVKNNAVLTIEPGVTIQFTNKGGGISIEDGATIKAVGLPKLLDAQGNVVTVGGVELDGHIKFVGVGTQKGTWNGITLDNTNADNQLVYVDLLNAGSESASVNTYAALYVYRTSRASIQHCTITNGLGYGVAIHSDSRLDAFDNNVIEGFDFEPVYANGSGGLQALGKFDITSTLTNNTKPYILTKLPQTLNEDATLNQTSVPYYIANSIDYMNKTLTINEGVTFYMGNGLGIQCEYGEGALIINGTVAKPVTFTRLPGATYYWEEISYRTANGHQIKNCILEYGGAGGATNHENNILDFWDVANVTLENVVIRNSYAYGIAWTKGNTRITHNNVTFENNISGNVQYYDGGQWQFLTTLP